MERRTLQTLFTYIFVTCGGLHSIHKPYAEGNVFVQHCFKHPDEKIAGGATRKTVSSADETGLRCKAMLVMAIRAELQKKRTTVVKQLLACAANSELRCPSGHNL